MLSEISPAMFHNTLVHKTCKSKNWRKVLGVNVKKVFSSLMFKALWGVSTVFFQSPVPRFPHIEKGVVISSISSWVIISNLKEETSKMDISREVATCWRHRRYRAAQWKASFSREPVQRSCKKVSPVSCLQMGATTIAAKKGFPPSASLQGHSQ